MFHCLLAEDAATGHPLGCVTISLARVEALLPPPFPSNAPLRLFISNLAVLERYRRQGVAKKLVKACSQLATRWSQDSIWLSVELDNSSALSLYEGLGFVRSSSGGQMIEKLKGSKRKVLMMKPIR